MLDRARGTATADPQGTTPASRLDPERSGTGSGESLYRKCPVCETVMNRRNFGKRSGVIVDTCREHGHWFDAHELDRILRWIRQGGEETVRRRAQDEARHRERLKRYERELPGSDPATRRPAGLDRSPGDGLLEGLMRAVLDI
jgi:Zn-finger nucleic acid-binding protein